MCCDFCYNNSCKFSLSPDNCLPQLEIRTHIKHSQQNIFVNKSLQFHSVLQRPTSKRSIFNKSLQFHSVLQRLASKRSIFNKPLQIHKDGPVRGESFVQTLLLLAFLCIFLTIFLHRLPQRTRSSQILCVAVSNTNTIYKTGLPVGIATNPTHHLVPVIAASFKTS